MSASTLQNGALPSNGHSKFHPIEEKSSSLLTNSFSDKNVSGNLYTKHTPSGSGNNGHIRPKLQRTTSFKDSRRLSSTLFDEEKIRVAGSKRRQESVSSAKKTSIVPLRKRSCGEKVRVSLVVMVTTSLIVSCSSFLFISLLILDPIIVGLRAGFSPHPGICRTIWTKNVSGPSNCVMPSCREGCTADLYICKFIYINYYEVPTLNMSYVENFYKNNDDDWTDLEELNFSPILNLLPNLTYFKNESENDLEILSESKNGTLMINPNGCGYPPDINCTKFEDRFSRNNSIFPCFYSSSFVNEFPGVAVPYYDTKNEYLNLSMYLGLPLALTIFLALFLLLLLGLLPNCRHLFKWRRKNGDEESLFVASLSKKRTGRIVDSSKTISLKNSFSFSTSTSSDKNGGHINNGHGPKKKKRHSPVRTNKSQFERHLDFVNNGRGNKKKLTSSNANNLPNSNNVKNNSSEIVILEEIRSITST